MEQFQVLPFVFYHIILLVLVEIVGAKGALLVDIELSFLLMPPFLLVLLHAGVEFLS